MPGATIFNGTDVPFIGRAVELDELRALLEEHRQLTLTGAGGSGKTRLALEAVRRRQDEQMGAALVVELVGVSTEDSLAAAVLARIGGREEPGRDPLESLIIRLRGDPTLLVLDNCEHLDAIGALVEGLLEECPQLGVLTTSRRPLGVRSEWVWQLPPMATSRSDTGDPLAAALASDASRLFVIHAARHDPSFALSAANAPTIVRICGVLDGLPLAIVLAAARCGERTLDELAESLAEDLSLLQAPSPGAARPEGLRGSIDWSYGLLENEERRLLRRLAVFHGAMASDLTKAFPDQGPEQSRSRLQRLAELGMVEPTVDPLLGEPFFTMAETVRERALELLEEAGEAEEARGRHLERFASLASEANDLLNDVRGRRALNLHSTNLNAALSRAIEIGDPLALQMCEQLTYWWFAADRFQEGRSTFRRALTAAKDDDPARRALALRGAAMLAVVVEDYAGAFVLAGEAVALAETSGEERAIGLALQAANLVLGTVDPRGAAENAHRAIELLRRSGSEHDLGHALLGLAFAEGLRDRFAGFDAARAEFMSIRAARIDEWLVILMGTQAGWARLVQGDPAAARAEADRVLEQVGGEVSTRAALARANRIHAMALAGEGGTALEQGIAEMEAAQAGGSEVGALTIEVGVAVAELAVGDFDSVLHRARSRLDTPALHAVVFWRESIARIALEREEPAPATAEAKAIRAISERTGSPRQRALADYLDGSCALMGGDLDAATELLHRALAEQTEADCHRDAIETLEALALLASAGSGGERAVRLLAAGAAARRTLGLVRVPLHGQASLNHIRQVGSDLGRSERQRARAEGERLSLSEAVAYARRSRGRRERALSGWASLTPTEAQAAELAAAGISNPEIARRLLMSRSTVKAHLSRAYAKLGVGNRTQLAGLDRPRPDEVGAPGSTSQSTTDADLGRSRSPTPGRP